MAPLGVMFDAGPAASLAEPGHSLALPATACTPEPVAWRLYSRRLDRDSGWLGTPRPLPPSTGTAPVRDCPWCSPRTSGSCAASTTPAVERPARRAGGVPGARLAQVEAMPVKQTSPTVRPPPAASRSRRRRATSIRSPTCSPCSTALTSMRSLPMCARTASASRINRRCNILRRGFRLMVRAKKLHVVPYIPRLKEHSPVGATSRPPNWRRSGSACRRTCAISSPSPTTTESARGNSRARCGATSIFPAASSNGRARTASADAPRRAARARRHARHRRAADGHGRRGSSARISSTARAARRPHAVARYGCVGDFKKAWADGAVEPASRSVARRADSSSITRATAPSPTWSRAACPKATP